MSLPIYSKKFIKKMLKEFPHFKNYYQEKKEEKELYALFNIPSNVELWVSTYGDEITIGYGEEHKHFSYNENENDDFDEAINFIKEIINK